MTYTLAERHRILRHGSLFSGGGGFDLAAQWIGWENIFQVENNKFCNKVLEKNFPNTKRYGDIKEFDGTKYRGSINIISGGFPCQPYADVGKRKGTQDDRHLWPEMYRIIGEIQPDYVVGENVLGLVNWSGGLVFDQIQADLENLNYKVLAFILPSCGGGAPHRRYRTYVIAYSGSDGHQSGGLEKNRSSENQGEIFTKERKRVWDNIGRIGEQVRGSTQPIICGGNNGLSNRMERLKLIGNAVDPILVYEIFKAIEATYSAQGDKGDTE